MKCTLVWLGVVVAMATIVHGDNSTSSNHVVPDSNHTSNDTRHVSTTPHHTDCHLVAHEVHTIHVASWRWDYVKSPLALCIFVFFAGLVKLGFHHADFLSSIIPESCVLIVLGTIVGAILFGIQDTGVFPTTLDPQLFFLYLLPPIVLEASYSLHDRTFSENFWTILVYAVIGTILNWFIVGPLLYGLAAAGAMGSITLTLTQALLFSALIVAVDPVAVLAIFQEVGVNNTLYFLVFGESLLNDAVTVVLYNTMKILNSMDIVPVGQIFLGVANFFTVSLGGTSIGIVFGVATAFMTKYTSHVRVVEPMLMLILAYGSYLTAELFHFSGIISMIACGLTQAQYAFHNVSDQSLTTITYFTKMLSAIADSVIFLFLGIAIVTHKHYGHVGFVLWTLFLILGARFFGTYGLTYIMNKKGRLHKISLNEQFIMAYGGLRGAVCFSLVIMLEDTGTCGTLPSQLRSIFVTTTLIVIIFTVFVQGITIKPLTKLLSIKTASSGHVTLSEEINVHMTDHILSGVEEVIGHFGENRLRHIVDHYDETYFKKWLQREPQRRDEEIMACYEEIALRTHYETINPTKPEMYDSIRDKLEEAGDDETPVLPPGAREHIARAALATGGFYAADDEFHEQRQRLMSLPLIGYTSPVKPMRRLSSFDSEAGMGEVTRRTSMFGKSMRSRPVLRKQKTIKDLTPNDLRKMLVLNPANMIHQKRGTMANENLEVYLQEKHMKHQQTRMSVLGSLDSPSQSPTFLRKDFEATHPKYSRSNSLPMQKLNAKKTPGSPHMSEIKEEDEERHRSFPKRSKTIDGSSSNLKGMAKENGRLSGDDTDMRPSSDVIDEAHTETRSDDVDVAIIDKVAPKHKGHLERCDAMESPEKSEDI